MAVLITMAIAACSVGGTDPFGPVPSGSGTPGAPSVLPSSAPAATPSAPAGTSVNSAAPSLSPAADPSPAKPATLPRGGRDVFPRFRLVGYAGLTGSPALGRLGTGALDQRVREMESRAKPYAADGRTILPVMEVIATVVQGSPGRDGKYRTRISDGQISTYLKSARKHRALLLLAIQPGRADFLDEVQHYQKWLVQPDVGVALDPEWAVGKGQRPGRVYGHTTGTELDSVASYLSGLVAEHDLPEKVMVFHELAPFIVTGESKLRARPGVAMVKSVDGIGSPAAKINTYKVVNADTPTFVDPGFKLFYTEDKQTGKRLMTPKEVLALKPRPSYVLYE